MKDKLEIGMYVRTNDGFIAKLIKKEEDYYYTGFSMTEYNKRLKGYTYKFDDQIWDSRLTDGYYDDCELGEEDIEELTIEPSFDILDLVREGDYVNGIKIYSIEKIGGKISLNGEPTNFCGVETILTKEVFDSMKYVIINKRG